MGGWLWKWKLKIQRRAKVFVQLLAHDRTLINLVRWRRNPIDNPICCGCGEENESTLHAIRDCPATIVVWSAIFPLDFLGQFFNTDLRGWHLLNLKSGTITRSLTSWMETSAIVAWNIWKWRWAELMRKKHLSFETKLEYLRASVRETKEAFEGIQRRSREGDPQTEAPRD